VYLPDMTPLPARRISPTRWPSPTRPPPRPSSSTAELFQLVCHAVDTSACRSPCAAAGRRACAPMANRAALGFCLADVRLRNAGVSKHF
jgi:hypothetical protein